MDDAASAVKFPMFEVCVPIRPLISFAVSELIAALVKLAMLDWAVPTGVPCKPPLIVKDEVVKATVDRLVKIELLGVCCPINAGASHVYPVRLRSMPIPF